MNLSAVIITFNEERNIDRCLKSIEGITDEIIVLDSFSTDLTEEICRKYQDVKFVQHIFDGHIQQKNRALDLASNDFVLSLDADEEVSPELRASILKIKQGPEADGYLINRLNNYCGKWIRHGSWYPDRNLRLFDRRKTRWAGINPHDKAEIQPDCRTSRIKGDLFHYSYATVGEHSRKLDYFSTLAADAYLKAGKRAPFAKLIFNPAFAFFRDYFLRLGFLDGYYGWLIARFSLYYTFLKYSKLRFLLSQAKNNNR